MLNALVGLDILTKEGNQFRPTAEAARYLDPTSPDFRGGMLQHGLNLWEPWSKLTDAIRRGGPVPRAERPRSGEEFMLAMHHNALRLAGRIAELLDLSGASRLLDLGGGPGTYAIAFARRNANLQVTVFDAPYALEFAARNAAEAGLVDRVLVRPGDFLTDDIGSGYDLVWGSHIIHSYGENDNRMLMGKIRRALAPGGRAVLHDFFLDDSHTDPPQAALFALNMLVNTPDGRSYATSEARQWLEAAGFSQFQHIGVDGPSSLLIAS